MVMASTLCKYDLRKGDLFVLNWAMVRRESISSGLIMCGGGVCQQIFSTILTFHMIILYCEVFSVSNFVV